MYSGMQNNMKLLNIVLLVAMFILIICLMRDQKRLARRVDELQANGDQQSSPRTTVQASGSEATRRKPSTGVDATATQPHAFKAEKKNGREVSEPVSMRLVSRVDLLEGDVDLLFEAADEAALERSEIREQVPPPSPNALANTKGRSWGPEQAVGPPNTHNAGDIPTAWAAREQNAGDEWLMLDYSNIVNLAEVRVHETYNPGAIVRVAAVLSDGSESVVWDGEYRPAASWGETIFEVEDDLESGSVVLYLDTTRVNGWNEIDAVSIVGRDGSTNWATDATASSTYAER